jgi:hypothetical protein
MENLEEQIVKLTEKWMMYIKDDHHKDRDCHWYINKVYSYGEPAKYRVEHYGYIGSEYVSKDVDTEEDAMLLLISRLTIEINKQIKWLKQNIKHREDDPEYEDWGIRTVEEDKELLAYLES